MADYKTSLLVNRQVPEFIRDDHPKFISFLEAYYEFLENKQGTEINDLTTVSKDMRYLSDVDYSLDAFEDSFFNTFLSLLPRNSEVTKEFLIKNILPVYLSKGSESSFKLLFRMLFGNEVSVSYPKDQILRASDGKWLIENVLRVGAVVSTVYTGNGTTKDFRLSQVVENGDISVFVNDVLVTNYFIKKELKKISFDTAPANNSTIEVTYDSFDVDLLRNRQITGSVSGATAIIERASKKITLGENYIQVFIDAKTLDGTFITGELVTTSFFNEFDETINVELSSLAEIRSIEVINGGANYNIGDPVIITGPSTSPAAAIVDDVTSGTIEDLLVLFGGAGFRIGNTISAGEFPNTSFNAVVQTVVADGKLSPNTVTIFNDVITAFANVALNVADYGFSSSGNTENIDTVIANSLNSVTIANLGPVVSVNVLTSVLTTGTGFDIKSTSVNGEITITDFGIIGRIGITDGGEDYVIGDQIIFTNQVDDYSGRGAVASVSNVSASGAITQIAITNGGLGYSKDNFPTVVANTANGGSGASLEVTAIMGDNEILQGVLPVDEEGNTVYPGTVLSIKVVNAGEGYVIEPFINMLNYGDGLATARATLLNSYGSLPGKWTTSDSILSSEDRKLQGRDYYINYSYLLSSQTEFSKYKEIFKQLIHPAGFVGYGEYKVDEQISANVPTSKILAVSNTISGTVNVNSSIYVVGTNTKFVLANTRGVLVPGSNVAINSQVRTVNTIVSNTEFTVTSAFTISSNNETIVILS